MKTCVWIAIFAAIVNAVYVDVETEVDRFVIPTWMINGKTNPDFYQSEQTKRERIERIRERRRRRREEVRGGTQSLYLLEEDKNEQDPKKLVIQ